MDTKETSIILVYERSTEVIGDNSLLNLTLVADKLLEILRAQITKNTRNYALIKDKCGFRGNTLYMARLGKLFREAR